MAKQVLVFGGTGYVGSALVEQLLSSGLQVVIICRAGSENKLASEILQNITVVHAEIDNLDPKLLSAYSFDTIIYSIGLLRETPHQHFMDFHVNWLASVIKLADELSIRNFILISANGVDQHSTPYATSKLAGERLLQKSTLNWIILRPSIILGPSDLYHFANVIRQLLVLPLVPMLGNGKFQFAPIDRLDLGRVVAYLVKNTNFSQRSYEVGNYQTISFIDIVRLFAKHWHKVAVFLHLPLMVVNFVVKVFGRFLPVTYDQLQMLYTGNITKDATIWKVTKLTPSTIEEIVARY